MYVVLEKVKLLKNILIINMIKKKTTDATLEFIEDPKFGKSIAIAIMQQVPNVRNVVRA